MKEPNWLVTVILGAILSIPLSLLTNLATPRFQSWLAQRSLSGRRKTLKRLEEEYQRIKELHDDRMLLILYIADVFARGLISIVLLMWFTAVAGAAFLSFPWISAPFRILIFLLLAVTFVMLILRWLLNTGVDTQRIREFDRYESEVMERINQLRDTATAAPSGDAEIRHLEGVAPQQLAKEPIFRDTFDNFVDWETYPSDKPSTISRSTDLKHIGSGSLLKKGAGDPHGGYKQIGRRIGIGFVLSGWIYCPGTRGGSKADRLAVEDENFNGYGFAVIHGGRGVWIERRDGGKGQKLEQFDFIPPEDEWYQFKFYVKTDGRLELRIYDSSGKALYRTPKDVTDEKYNSFDRVAVHGGSPYYVDELEIRTL